MRGKGTLYSLSREGVGTAGPLVTALTVAVVEAAEKYATSQPGGRYFYAPQSFADESGRRVMFGWLQEGRTEAAMVEAGWSGVMSLPRVATLGAGAERVFAPVPEMETLRRDHARIGCRTLSGREVLARVSGNQLDLGLDVELERGCLPAGGPGFQASRARGRVSPDGRLADGGSLRRPPAAVPLTSPRRLLRNGPFEAS